MSLAYYNELEKFPCGVIETNIQRGRLPRGKVHCADIKTVMPADLEPFRQLHLFAGIGAAAYACRLAGIPDDFSLCTFGFPCQDISTAGKGAGLEGERSGLFFEAVRLIEVVRPTWLLAENVPALRSRGIDRCLTELEGAGYCVLPPIVVGADDVGAPHKRKRVWIVARRADESLPQLGNPGNIMVQQGRADARGMGEAPTIQNRGGQNSICNTSAYSGGDELGHSQSQRSGRISTRSRRERQGAANANRASQWMADTARLNEVGSLMESSESGRLAGTIGECGRNQLADSDSSGLGEQRATLTVPAQHTAAFSGSVLRRDQLADSQCQRRKVWFDQRSQSLSRGQQTPDSAFPFRWPSRPGEPQHDWESPRTIEPPLGGPTDGLAKRLVRQHSSWRRNALKGLGNAWVAQVPVSILRWMHQMEVAL
ncbi:hypothetical protein EON83_12445 [bacterium]|nr:MAG: hypothetical protein EON83_12445 [bacterium]